MAFALTPEREKKVEELIGRYPSKRAALLPILHVCQEQHGWVDGDVIAWTATKLGLETSQVKGVVTFYTMYHQHPVGRHFVQICTTSPCNLCGAEDVMKAFLKESGAGELGATSPDGRWTVIEVECLGACGFATPILVDDDFIENVTAEKVKEIVRKYL